MQQRLPAVVYACWGWICHARVKCPDLLHVWACVIVLMSALQQEQDECVKLEPLLDTKLHLLLIFGWIGNVWKGNISNR